MIPSSKDGEAGEVTAKLVCFVYEKEKVSGKHEELRERVVEVQSALKGNNNTSGSWNAHDVRAIGMPNGSGTLQGRRT